MGLVLGMLGGGGGILTVPILVGFFAMTPTIATGNSLLVVGLSSAVGAAQGLWQRQVDVRSSLLIAIPSMAGAYSSRAYLVTAIPEHIGPMRRDQLLLGLFAILMVVVGIRMLRPPSSAESADPKVAHWTTITLVGLLIGLVSGLLGAGGGFLILPALAVLLGMDIKRAIPTSLLVITIQSLGGFVGELHRPIEWELLGRISGVAVGGLLLGLTVRSRVPKRQLQIAFAVLVFAVAAWMATRIFGII